jgi:CubicO group peptidase (beta-lactamase class C family)
VIRQGEILYERYYQDHGPDQISQVFSVSKSVTSALVGAAIQDGLIESVDQPVTDFLPELAAQGWDQVSLGQLLSMTSGSDYVENDNPFGEHVIFNYTPDLEARILEQRMVDEPGSEWRYKSGDNALLGLILDRVVAPRSLTDYAQEKLWTPLGMEHDGRWSIDQAGEAGLERTWCCLAASARDLAKIGQLYLQDGVANGEQVIPPGWVAESTQPAFADALWGADYRAIGVRGYGYQWWLASQDEGDFFALGKDGQYLYVNPTTEVIIVRLGWSSGDLPLSAWLSLFQYIAGGL